MAEVKAALEEVKEERELWPVEVNREVKEESGCREPSEKKMLASAQKQKEMLGDKSLPLTDVTATPGTPEDGNDVNPDDSVSDSEKSSDSFCSDEDYVPCPSTSSDESSSEELFCTRSTVPASNRDSTDLSSKHHSSKQRKKIVPNPIDCMEQEDNETPISGKEEFVADNEFSDNETTTGNVQNPPTTTDSFSDVSVRTKNVQASKESNCTKKNYCYVCKTPQSKIGRHLEKHKKEEPDIAKAFLLPKYSKERKKLLEKLRNKGNYEHNQEVLTNNNGLLKVKRQSKQSKNSLKNKNYVHCAYCKGMFIRKELWRHSQRCPSKTVSESDTIGGVKMNCLALADIAESTCTQAISPGLWKILKNMRQDEITAVVRNDFQILQMSQALYNKHGSDPTKFEYMRQKAREMGRLLLTLKKTKSIFSFEDAIKPKNFDKVIGAVKTLAGYDEEKNCYRAPSLALKLGHSLKKIGDIILCRAIAAEDEQMIKDAERFTQLCTTQWTELVSHTPLASLTKSKFNKPSTLPFTEDVQLLHQYLEKKSADAVENLKQHESPQTYAELARVTLAQIIIFNRRCADEVSNMSLESFERRDQTELREDIAAGFSQFEQKLAKHLSRVEVIGKRGKTVAVLLNPDVLHAAVLITERRDACNVHKDNPFLFGQPQCSSTSHYRGQDCIRKFARMCGAKNPEHLRSTHLRKHVATLSQILNLKDNELDQLANFLGHDIRVHRDFYRLPEATVELAKISKLLVAMEKGSLAKFQGKSFEEIEVEDELGPDSDEDELDDESDGEKNDSGDENSDDEGSGGKSDIDGGAADYANTGGGGDNCSGDGSSNIKLEHAPEQREKRKERELYQDKAEQMETFTGVHSPHEAGPNLDRIKEEPQNIQIKQEEVEMLPVIVSVKSEKEESVLHETVKEENREDSDGAESESSSDTDDSADWTPSAESPTPQTHTVQEATHGDNDPDTPHQCSQCGKKFLTITKLKRHEHRHRKKKNFRCSHCVRRFFSRTDLENHTRTHTGERPFKCSICDKTYSLSGNLKRHMSTHIGEKLFQCQVCSKGFSYKHTLKIHMRTHTGERMFECSFCSKTFSQEFNMKKHMMTHTTTDTWKNPFRCMVCSKEFPYKCTLNRHMKTHTEKKTFRCEICKVCFLGDNYLKNHMQTHSI